MAKTESTIKAKVIESFADETDGLKTKEAGRSYPFTVERYEELLGKGKIEKIKEDTKEENKD